ncbi:hypothetical protein HA402_013406 [Bradysia odoriphaga]|nr:hypothetical protein HA402_013406 [Bradysia odoriphaga]
MKLDHNESLDAKLWDTLTAELNAIGPVVQTPSKWRRSWSVHKYNLKKHVQKSMAEVDDMESTTSQDVRSNSCQPDPTDQTSIWHTVLEQLEIINQKQDAMDKKIDKISNQIFKNHSSELM